MSQHIFETTYQNRPVRVVMGWDRPLQGYFMFVERLDVEHKHEICDDENEDLPEIQSGDAFLYDNLADANPWRCSVDYYVGKLAELGIDVPERLITEVEWDGRMNAGNRVELYS